VVIWRHRGKQHKEYFATLAEAREAKGRRAAGDRRPPSRDLFEDYALAWVGSYAGRTSRGFEETTRVEYRRALEARAIPHFGRWRLDEIGGARRARVLRAPPGGGRERSRRPQGEGAALGAVR
jgi:hypothetical protein